jgi:hypothetical protein
MQKVTINKLSLLRILVGVYLFPLYLVVFSLSVPPADLPLCGLMFVLAGAGFLLARHESRAWRLVWVLALVASVLCGVLQVVAGHRIARQRSHHQSSMGWGTANQGVERMGASRSGQWQFERLRRLAATAHTCRYV